MSTEEYLNSDVCNAITAAISFDNDLETSFQIDLVPDEGRNELINQICEDVITPIVSDIVEPDQLKELLKLWNLEFLYNKFLELGIDFDCLKFLDLNDIFTIVGTDKSSYGTAVKLKGNLKLWRKNNGYEELIPDGISEIDTISAPSTISSWIGDLVHSPSCSSICSSGNQTKIKVEDILNNTGQYILDSYKISGKLNDNNRSDLINLITDSIFKNKIQLKASDISEIADQIVRLFPTEIKSIYFSPRHGCCPPKGKLFDRYNNRLKRLRKKELYPESRFKRNRKSPDTQSSAASQDEFDETQIESDKNFLKYNKDDWITCIEKWDRLFKYRKNYLEINQQYTLQQILSDWPILSHPLGYTLVTRDFTVLYGEEVAMRLLNNWPKFIEKFPVLVQKIKDKKNKSLYETLTKDTSEDGRDAVLLLVLHSIIQPKVRIPINKSGTKKDIWRPSISSSQDSFLIHIITENDILPTAERRSKMYKEMGIGCQPYIIAVGESLLSVNKFFIIMENILYKVDSLTKAVDVCFKIYTILNLKYAFECELVWTFLETYFYKLCSSNKKLPKISPSVSCIIKELE